MDTAPQFTLEDLRHDSVRHDIGKEVLSRLRDAILSLPEYLLHDEYYADAKITLLRVIELQGREIHQFLVNAWNPKREDYFMVTMAGTELEIFTMRAKLIHQEGDRAVPGDLDDVALACLESDCCPAYVSCPTFLSGRKEHLRRKLEDTEKSLRESDALSDQVRAAKHAEIGSIKWATGRLISGVYGRCVMCGEDIGKQRLEALPDARCCLACSG